MHGTTTPTTGLHVEVRTDPLGTAPWQVVDTSYGVRRTVYTGTLFECIDWRTEHTTTQED